MIELSVFKTFLNKNVDVIVRDCGIQGSYRGLLTNISEDGTFWVGNEELIGDCENGIMYGIHNIREIK